MGQIPFSALAKNKPYTKNPWPTTLSGEIGLSIIVFLVLCIIVIGGGILLWR